MKLRGLHDHCVRSGALSGFGVYTRRNCRLVHVFDRVDHPLHIIKRLMCLLLLQSWQW